MKKKAKIITSLIILGAVIAFGVFMANQVFAFLERKGQSAEQIPQTPIETATAIKAETDLPASASENPQEEKQQEPVEEQPAVEFDPQTSNWSIYISVPGANIRSDSSTKGSVLFRLAKNAKGKVLEKKNGWTLARWDYTQKNGWIRDDLALQGPAAILDAMVKNTQDISTIKLSQVTSSAIAAMNKESKVAIALAEPADPAETSNTYSEGNRELPKHGTIVPHSGANIREKATRDSNRVAKLPRGTIVGIKSVAKSGKYEWFEITFDNGKNSGWTREDNLKF
ncbi:MAG: SH3 domain-containing protein [Candidatus Riflebacteria bacterium]|nr:SH3 domain-containing protein [Candidatus Riflebacteria bacterium]